MRRVLALCLLASGLVAAAPASSSPAHVPASNGWIVFASNADGTGAFVLQRLEPLGGRVTSLGLDGKEPAWSPDGSLIAFVDAHHRLVVVRSDGTGARVLTTGGYAAHDPSWSPDGSRIVFSQSGRRRYRGDLVVVTSDGSRLRRITRTNHDDVEPAWSPDGSLIAFSSDRPRVRVDDYEILAVAPDGTRMHPLTMNRFYDREPSWSPDGAVIAFVSGRDPSKFNPSLWTMRRDGGSERLVQPASAPSGFPSWADTSPSWSPDGQWLVYVTTQTSFPENVFIVRPDGRDKLDLTPETSSTDVDPAWQPVCSDPGTAGDDTLAGGATDDRVCGFGGSDVLRGGAGSDGLYGGDGSDRISSRDGDFDVVGCGAGRDSVTADANDLVGVDCEHVRRR